MPDGQLLSPSILKIPLIDVLRKPVAAVHRSFDPDFGSKVALLGRNSELFAENALLKAALHEQKARSSDLRNILLSMQLATLCVCPSLTLRFFTAAASRMFEITLGDLGSALSFASLALDGELIAQVDAALRSEVPKERGIEVPAGRNCVCRLRPLNVFQASASSVDGVLLTFVAATTSPGRSPPTDRAQHDSVCRGPDRRDDYLSPGSLGLAIGLTRRQQQILELVLAGCPNKNIAADLGISQRTVENHRAAIMQRTGATSLPALTRMAFGVEVGGDCKTNVAQQPVPVHSCETKICT